MKLCKDCKHCVPDWSLRGWLLGKPTLGAFAHAECNAAKVTRINPASGEVSHLRPPCTFERSCLGQCDSHAKRWEPRQ